jgi:SAM-dependent methyltransferase
MTATMRVQHLLPRYSTQVDNAQIQGELWDARADHWAQYQEETARPLFHSVLARMNIAVGLFYLDIGCGAGAALAIAAARGALVAGVDISPTLLAIAKTRVPNGDFRYGDMEDLPFGNSLVDRFTFFNTIQYASDPVAALKEASRVAKPGARGALTTWGKSEDCDLSTYLEKRRSLLPPSSLARHHKTFDLSAEGALEALTTKAGLVPDEIGQVDCPITYPNLKTALLGLLSTGTAERAIRHSGEAAVCRFTTEALAPFRLPNGSYRLRNKFLYIIATVK